VIVIDLTCSGQRGLMHQGTVMNTLTWTALGAALVLAACSQQIAQAPAAEAPAARTEAELVAHGKYLVEGVAGCNDCHTVMTPQGPDMTRSLQGASLMFKATVEMPWAPVAPPLAGGPANYTDAQFATLLQTGVKPDGSRPLPPMPAFRLNEEDARAVVAYIKTLPKAAP
jgi:mono/diheme cytochrome c family protein